MVHKSLKYDAQWRERGYEVVACGSNINVRPRKEVIYHSNHYSYSRLKLQIMATRISRDVYKYIVIYGSSLTECISRMSMSMMNYKEFYGRINF